MTAVRPLARFLRLFSQFWGVSQSVHRSSSLVTYEPSVLGIHVSNNLARLRARWESRSVSYITDNGLPKFVTLG